MTPASRLNLRLLQAEVFNERKPSTSPMNACLHDGRLSHAAPRVSCQGHIENKIITNLASIQESYITMF